MSDAVAAVVGIVLLAGNAFFVGAEFALISARRTQIEPRAAAGSRRARTTLRAMEQVSLMMAGAQLGITVCSLGLGAVAEPAVAHAIEGPLHAAGLPDDLLHPIAFTIALSIVVFLHMVLGEMVPKNIAIAGPERSALWLGPPLFAVVRVLRPLIVGLNAIANAVLRLLRVEPKEEVASAFTADEVAAMIRESREEGLLDDRDHELLEGALNLDMGTVADVVLPPDRLVTLPVTATAADVEAATARTGFSRFPVTDGSGAATGYVHVKDALGVADDARDLPLAPPLVRPLVRLPPDATLRQALGAMRDEGAHLAAVTGDDGRDTAGIVALEDVVEELVGEIRDATARPAGGRPMGGRQS